MKTTATMQRIIEQIAAKNGLDMTASEAHLRLNNEPYMPLVIEKVGKDFVSVAHYYEQNGDLVADPEVVFYTGYGEWVPVEMTQPPMMIMGRAIGGTQRLVTFEDGKAVRYAPKQQASVASFCRTWAKNIREQQWLKCGAKE